MQSSLITTILYCVFISTTFCQLQTCNCPVNNQLLPDPVPYGSVSPTNIIVNNTDYGPIICTKGVNGSNPVPFVKKDVVLTLATVQYCYYDPNTYNCPYGFSPPTEQDLIAVMQNDSFATDPTLWNANTSRQYISSVKCYPNLLDGSVSAAWDYRTLRWVSGNPQIANISMYTSARKFNLGVRCVQQSNFPVTITGMPSGNAIVGTQYTLSASVANALSYLWFLPNGTVISSASSASFTATTPGCMPITLKVRLFCDVIVTKCIKFWADTNASPLTTPSDVSSTTTTYFATRTNSVFFDRSAAPIVPLTTGGAYLLFTDKNTGLINLLTLDNTGNVLNAVDLNINGSAFDFTVIPPSNDIVIMVKDVNDSNYFYITRVTNMGDFVWRLCIMNNGPGKPQVALQQVSSGSPPLDGMQVMYRTENGKIRYGNGKLFTIFGHFNHFPDGSDHTGDTVLLIDPDDPNNYQVVVSWGCSHSVVQDAYFDGTFFQSAAIGDEYPEDLHVLLYNPSLDPITYFFSENLFPGFIPGDGKGYSCGRLGAIMPGPWGGYAVTYQRKPCGPGDTVINATNSIAEVGVVFYDEKFDVTGSASLNVPDVTTINVIKSGWSGNALVILYATTAATYATQYVAYYYSESQTTSFYYMVLDIYGNIITQPFAATLSITATDNMVVLQDGTLMWPYITESLNLIIQYIPPPSPVPPTTPPTAPSTVPPTAPPTNPPTAPPTAPPRAPSNPPSTPPNTPPKAPSTPPSSPTAPPTNPPTTPPRAPSNPPTTPPNTPPKAPSVPPTTPPTNPPTTPPKAPSTPPSSPTIPPSTSPKAPSNPPSTPPNTPPRAPSVPPTTPPTNPPTTPPKAPSTPPSSPTTPPTTSPKAPSNPPSTSPTTPPTTSPKAPSNPPSMNPPTTPPKAPSIPPSSPTTPPTTPPSTPPNTPPRAPSVPPTTPPTNPSTNPPTVPPTNPPTVSPTTPPTNPPTIPPTAPPTIPPAEPPTEPPTVPPTEPPTTPPTIPPSNPPMAPFAPPTPSPTDIATLINNTVNITVLNEAFSKANVTCNVISIIASVSSNRVTITIHIKIPSSATYQDLNNIKNIIVRTLASASCTSANNWSVRIVLSSTLKRDGSQDYQVIAQYSPNPSGASRCWYHVIFLTGVVWLGSMMF